MEDLMIRSLLPLLLFACSGDSKDPPADDTDDTTTDTDTGFTDTDGGSDDPIVLRGVLKDVDGALITAGLRLQYCRGADCRTPQDFADGAYAFRGVPTGPGSFETVTIGGSIRYANAFAPINVTEGVERELDAVVPVLGPEVAIPATEAELQPAPGLFLTLADDKLDRPSAFEDVPTAIAGVDATEWHLPVEGVAGEVLAMYYLWPFNAPSTSGPIPVKLTDRWSLNSGEAELWAGDYYTSSWIKVGDLDDNADVLTPAGGGGLDRLTTVLVVRKP
jgi:hypothetical protein